MNETTNQLAGKELIESKRQHDYRAIAQLLKEYTARLHRMTNSLGIYLEKNCPSEGGAPPWRIYRHISRFQAIHKEIESATLVTSQMLVHFDFAPGESAELRLRLADAEHGLRACERLVSAIVERMKLNLNLDGQLPDPPEGDVKRKRARGS